MCVCVYNLDTDSNLICRYRCLWSCVQFFVFVYRINLLSCTYLPKNIFIWFLLRKNCLHEKDVIFVKLRKKVHPVEWRGIFFFFFLWTGIPMHWRKCEWSVHKLVYQSKSENTLCLILGGVKFLTICRSILVYFRKKK